MLDIMEGKRPPRPEHPAFSPDLWILMERCWNQEPSSRPDISEVLRALISSSVFLSPPGSVIRCLDYFIACRDSSSERDPTTGQLPIFGPPFDPLRRIQALPKSSPHFPQQLAGVFENKEFRNSVQYLQGERLAMLVNELDSVRSGVLLSSFLALTPLMFGIAPRYSRPGEFGLSKVPTRTQEDMWCF